MVDSLRTEQMRMDQAKLALERQNESQLKDIKDKQKGEIERLVERHSEIKGSLDKAYEIDLAMTRDGHEKHLDEVRQSNAKILADEKAKGEEEVEKTKSRYQEQIARYRENAEKQLQEMRNKNDDSADRIRRAHERGRG